MSRTSNAVLLLTSKAGSFTSLEGLLTRRLSELGVTPVVVAPPASPIIEGASRLGVATEVLAGLQDPRTLGGLLRLPMAVVRLKQIIDRHRVALIHSLRGSLTPAALWLSQLTGIPHLCHLQFLYEDPAKYRKLRLHRAENVAAVAQAIVDALVQACPHRRAARMVVIPNGIDADAFVALGRAIEVRGRYGIPDDAFVLGMVGSMDARKDPQALIRAASTVVRRIPTVHLLLVGPFRNPLYERSTRALVAQLELSGRCHFVGFQANPSPFFRAMDVFVLPSRGDAQGLVLLEAMAHAKPIVTTRVGGIPDTVQDGLTGQLVGPGDIDGFVHAIEAFARDPERRRAFGTRARKQVEEEFSATRSLDRIVGLYTEILQG